MIAGSSVYIFSAFSLNMLISQNNNPLSDTGDLQTDMQAPKCCYDSNSQYNRSLLQYNMYLFQTSFSQVVQCGVINNTKEREREKESVRGVGYFSLCFLFYNKTYRVSSRKVVNPGGRLMRATERTVELCRPGCLSARRQKYGEGEAETQRPGFIQETTDS